MARPGTDTPRQWLIAGSPAGAVRDIAEAYRWNEEQRSRWWSSWSVEDCLYTIQRHPEMYAIAHESYRRAVMKRFPIIIFSTSVSVEAAHYPIVGIFALGTPRPVPTLPLQACQERMGEQRQRGMG